MRSNVTNLVVLAVCGVVSACTPTAVDFARYQNKSASAFSYQRSSSLEGRLSYGEDTFAADYLRPVQLVSEGATYVQPRIVQTLEIASGKSRSQITSALIAKHEAHGFLVMLKSRSLNRKFCEALVNNLQFLKEEILTSLAETGPNTQFRKTFMYDVRAPEELRKIERPEQLSKDDCDEFIPNLDYGTMSLLAARIGIRTSTGGPWLLAVEPLGRWAIEFDFSQKGDELDAALDQWNEVLQDPAAWRERNSGFFNFLLRYVGKNNHIRIVTLPPDFSK
jgi:hypothetical protein